MELEPPICACGEPKVRRIDTKGRKRGWKCKPRLSRAQTERQRRDPARHAANNRAYHLRLRGLTKDAYEALLVAQGGSCAVCGADRGDSVRKSFHVDHDHKTGIVRGLLCGRCNMALGLLDDDLDRVVALVAYLRNCGDCSHGRLTNAQAKSLGATV